MKYLLLMCATFVLFSTEVFACMGGHLVSMNDYKEKGGAVLAVLNKSEKKFKITMPEEGWRFREIITTIINKEKKEVILTGDLCDEHDLGCSIVTVGATPVIEVALPKFLHDKRLSFRFQVHIGNPKQYMLRRYIFETDINAITRGVGSCGEINLPR